MFFNKAWKENPTTPGENVKYHLERKNGLLLGKNKLRMLNWTLDNGDMLQVSDIDCWGRKSWSLDGGAAAWAGTAVGLHDQLSWDGGGSDESSSRWKHTSWMAFSAPDGGCCESVMQSVWLKSLLIMNWDRHDEQSRLSWKDITIYRRLFLCDTLMWHNYCGKNIVIVWVHLWTPFISMATVMFIVCKYTGICTVMYIFLHCVLCLYWYAQ